MRFIRKISFNKTREKQRHAEHYYTMKLLGSMDSDGMVIK